MDRGTEFSVKHRLIGVMFGNGALPTRPVTARCERRCNGNIPQKEIYGYERKQAETHRNSYNRKKSEELTIQFVVAGGRTATGTVGTVGFGKNTHSV
jgi:hypothetical protein